MKRLIIFLSGTALCLLNREFGHLIPDGGMSVFMSCYFNDLVGAAAFSAYCDAAFTLFGRRLDRLYKLELILFFCGIFWEYITPLFRSDTVSDPVDIAAYMAGGLVYMLISRLSGKQILQQKQSRKPETK